MRHPLRREYAPTSGAKDVDQAARTQKFRAFGWSLVGAFGGLLWGGVGMAAGSWGVGGLLLAVAGMWGLTFFFPLALSAAGGRAATTIHNPSGRSTPSKREYSHAESLVARGLYQEAIDAFELAIAEDPSDPVPYLRVARVYREELRRHEDAARWFKRALAESDAAPGIAVLATRELVELYVTKLGEPARAAPLLARMAEERAGTPEGAWAAEELASVKAAMLEEGGA